MIGPLRRQLPVYSPLTAKGIGAGIESTLVGTREAAEAGLRQRLTERHGVSDVWLTDSGTSALAVALRAAAGPAALPAFCCYDIATACDGAGVEPFLYDLDPETLAPVPDSLERALAGGARAIVVAHLFGVPVPMDSVRSVAARAGALVIEDAAQGSGASAGGRPLGAGGDAGILSFGRGKGVTGGGGGALLVASERMHALLADVGPVLAQPSRLPIRDIVATVAQYLMARPSLYRLPASLPFLGLGATVYRRPSAPRRISAFSLGLVSESLEAEAAEVRTRRATGEQLAHVVAKESGGRMRPLAPVLRGAEPGFLRLPVLAMDQAAHDILASARAAELGILPSYPQSLADLEGFGERVGNRGDEFSGARLLAQRLVTFPTHSRLSKRDLLAIGDLVRAA